MNKAKSHLKALKKIFAKNEEALSYLRELEMLLPSVVEGEDKAQVEGLFPLPTDVELKELSFFLFCDGSCKGNPGPGAYALMGQNSQGEVIFKSTNVDMNTTNNRMELLGAISSLREMIHYAHENKIAEKEIFVYLYSDSRYVIDGTNEWLPNWKRRGWKKADQKTPENVDLWQEWDQVLSAFKGEYQFHWVRGHDGHPQNEHCDEMANRALSEALSL